MNNIKWDASMAESLLIAGIVRRYSRIIKDLAGEDAIAVDTLSLVMDLTACHANGCPLRLAELAKARAVDLCHDVQGIQRHMDRETGKLTGCFVPRYARSEPPDPIATARHRGAERNALIKGKYDAQRARSERSARRPK